MHLTLVNPLPLFPSAVLIQNMNRTQANQNPRYFENNDSNFDSVFWANKTIQNRNLNIIGTQFFKKSFINKNEKYWRSFNSKIFKKDIVFDPDQLPNWVNSAKFEFTQLKSDQINQLKSNTLQKLLDLLCFSNIIDDFESNLNLNNEVE